MKGLHSSLRVLLKRYIKDLSEHDLRRHDALLARRWQIHHDQYVVVEPEPIRIEKASDKKSGEETQAAAARQDEAASEMPHKELPERPAQEEDSSKLPSKGVPHHMEEEEPDTWVPRRDELEALTNSAGSIFEPYAKIYRQVRNQWLDSQQLAVESGQYQQIPTPTSLEDLFRRIGKGFGVMWRRLKRFFEINLFRLTGFQFEMNIQISVTIVVVFGICGTILPVPDAFQRADLIDLQEEVLSAESLMEKQAIVNRLYNYYTNQSVPDSMRQKVVDYAQNELVAKLEVETLNEIIARRRAALAGPDSAAPQTESYMVEAQLRRQLLKAIVSRVRGHRELSDSLFAEAHDLAREIYEQTECAYWCDWVLKVSRFDRTLAKKWLRAYSAERLCFAIYKIDFERAQHYAAVGLRILSEIPDQKLRLDFTQRIMIMLSENRGLLDLALVIGERSIKHADRLGFQLRGLGLQYNYAEVLVAAGQAEMATKAYREATRRATQLSASPSTPYYYLMSQMGSAKAEWDSGNYLQALNICNQISQLSLDSSAHHTLYNTRAITHRALGNYDQAEADYNMALDFLQAGDVSNQIVVWSNLGELFFRLGEYDEAQKYYQKAFDLHLQYNRENIEQRMRLLGLLGELAVEQKDTASLDKYNKQIQDLIAVVDFPIVKGDYLVSTGRLNLTAENYPLAIQSFQSAIKIYDQSGLIRKSLENRTYLIQSHLKAEEYQQVQNELKQMEELANRLQDSQGQIDALGLFAQVAAAQGQLAEALEYSNKLFPAIENVSQSFSNLDNLMRFRRRIHTYLQQAVEYELKSGNVREAFIKLDYLKARESKHSFQDALKAGAKSKGFFRTDIDKVKANLRTDDLLLNYMVTDETLYLFALDKDTLNLHLKLLKKEELYRVSYDLLTEINNTKSHLKKFDPLLLAQNYDAVDKAIDKISEISLGWPELREKLMSKKRVLFIPDDILHGIPFACLKYTDSAKDGYIVEIASQVTIPSAFFLQLKPLLSSAVSFDAPRILVSADRASFKSADYFVAELRKMFPKVEELVVADTLIETNVFPDHVAGQFDIYFFIGHSRADPDFPDGSVFEITAMRESDGKPITQEIHLRNFKKKDWSEAQFVFLVGCETANGKLYEGSGFSGFQQALLARGVKACLASLWEIDSRRAFDQLLNFLRLVQDGHPPDKALQLTEKKWIQVFNNDEIYEAAHPYLWKLFTLAQTAYI